MISTALKPRAYAGQSPFEARTDLMSKVQTGVNEYVETDLEAASSSRANSRQLLLASPAVEQVRDLFGYEPDEKHEH